MKMTKFFAMALPLCVGALLAGCSDAATEEEIAPAPVVTTHTFTATILNDDTRAYVGSEEMGYKVCWNKGDEMSFFPIGQTTPVKATQIGESGYPIGTFTYEGDKPTTGAGCFGVFPYNAKDQIDRLTIVTELPTAQTYKAGSHGGTNVFMTDYTVATETEGSLDALQVYNSYLGLWLKGSGTGFKIKVQSRYEPLAGQVRIATPYMDKNGNYVDYPVATTTAESSKEVTFDCSSVELTDEAKPFCVALLPGTYKQLRITVTDLDGEEQFRGNVLNLTLNQGLIRMMNKNAVKALKLPVPEQPGNPGNMNSWGGPNQDIQYTYSPLKKVATADGWTTNVDIYGTGGFATKITYNQNGIINNLLTSKGGTSCYFQWGRWLGFPVSSKLIEIYSGGSCNGGAINLQSQLLPGGIGGPSDMTLGYYFPGEQYAFPVTYANCYMGSGYSRTRALNSSIIFGKITSFSGHMDYIGANEDCTWSDRCGNPCPDGYRIPTADELAALIPSTGEINGSYAEVKTVDGVKYAMRWKVNTTPEVPYVDICSVKTTANTVSVDDPIFENATVIRLKGWGILNNECNQKLYGETGLYWSCESAKIDGTNYNGGIGLEIDFYSGNKAEMYMGAFYRSFAGCVMPIKDDAAKATPLTPWLPVYNI